VPARSISDFLNPERNSFGLVRLAAALAVVASHAFGLATGDLYADPVFRWTGLTLGQHAVDVFFVLSGLMVTASLMRSPDLWHYLKSRALRIFPGLAVCTLICALVLGPLASSLPITEYFARLATFKYIATTLLLISGRAPLPEVFGTTPMGDIVNFSVWTLKYEVVCYLALAAAAFVGALKSERIARLGLAALLGLIFISYAVPGLVEHGGTADTARRFALCFGLGSAGYFARRQVVVSWLGLALVVFATAVTYQTRLQDFASVLLMAYVSLMFAGRRWGALSSFADHTDLSFGVYLYGWPVGQLLVLGFGPLGVAAVTLLSLVLLLPVAYLSWRFIEAPALRLRHASGRRQAGRNGAATPAQVRLQALTGKPVGEVPPPAPVMTPVLRRRMARVKASELPAEALKYRRVAIEPAA